MRGRKTCELAGHMPFRNRIQERPESRRLSGVAFFDTVRRQNKTCLLRATAVSMAQTRPRRWGSHIINIADLREAAERRIPKVVFDYLDGGADREVTLKENC